jgi:hypothetical protein
MRDEAKARRAVHVYVWLCGLAAIPPMLIRSDTAESFLLLIVVLTFPWSRVFGALLDHFALASWLLVPLLLIGVAINATALYWLFGGRFRAPDV